MNMHPAIMLMCIASTFFVPLAAEEEVDAGAAAEHVRTSSIIRSRPDAPHHDVATPDAQALLDDLLRKHPELKEVFAAAGGQGMKPRPGAGCKQSHCTGTVNGKTVYDGPGSSISVTTRADGNGSRDEVVVDGKRVQGH